MLFVVCIVRFSSRKGILANFSPPFLAWLCGQGSYDTSMVLLQPSLADKALDTRSIWAKVKGSCFHSFWNRKTSKRIQKASAGTHWEGCPDPFFKFRTYSLCRSCWIGAGRLIHAYPCFYRDHKKADQRRDSKEGFRWIPPIRPVLS